MAAKYKSGYFGISKKGGADKYVGPSGKHFDLAQVKMFYANKGKFPGQKPKAARAGWRAAAHQRKVHDATHGKSL
jgi:hypothetical protein